MESSRILLSTIIPIGNLAVDFENLRNIIRLSDAKPIELVFILDTGEEQAFKQLQLLCFNERLPSFQIVEGTGRNPGASRNIGISLAQGEWVIFCDSDDMPNFVNIINSISQDRNDSDVLIGDYEIENLTLKTVYARIMDKNSNSIWESIALYPGLWRWVIKKELLMGVSFPEYSMGEDQCFLIRILSKEPKVNFFSEVLYRYRIGGRSSLTSTKTKINDLIPIIRLELSQNRFPQNFISFKNFVVIRQIFTLVKHGTFVGKSWALILFVKYISSHSPAEYLTTLIDIVKVLRATSKI